MDEYHQQLRAYADQDDAARINNPVFHIHGHNVPQSDMVVPFSMLLNLAAVANADDKDQLWALSVQRYAPDASPETNPQLDQVWLCRALLQRLCETHESVPRRNSIWNARH